MSQTRSSVTEDTGWEDACASSREDWVEIVPHQSVILPFTEKLLFLNEPILREQKRLLHLGCVIEWLLFFWVYFGVHFTTLIHCLLPEEGT